LWHWFYFLPRAPQALARVDGHPQRGGFMPPIPYPRRMFAGARMRFHAPLLIGQPARREALIRDIRLKSGRSGALAFVSVLCRFYQDGPAVYRGGTGHRLPRTGAGRRLPARARLAAVAGRRLHAHRDA
jgi:hydroxyacyl-ACP dehydratase HTD2-like protein with hotdog domain